MKTAIITGGAQGIGKAISCILAKKGYNVVINYNTSEKEALELKKYIENNNGIAEVFKADLTKREDAKKLIQFTIEKFKNIDVLINNAGVSLIKLFTDYTDEDWNRIINNNLYSAFCTTQEAVKFMINRKCGCIINISSIWGEIGASCECLYAITKAGVDALTKSLAKELGPSNIRVNSIAPGIINTRMNNHLSDEEKVDIKEEIPLEKIGEPEDIAKCVEWLIEDNYTTGQVISINGGWSI